MISSDIKLTLCMTPVYMTLPGYVYIFNLNTKEVQARGFL